MRRSIAVYIVRHILIFPIESSPDMNHVEYCYFDRLEGQGLKFSFLFAPLEPLEVVKVVAASFFDRRSL